MVQTIKTGVARKHRALPIIALVTLSAFTLAACNEEPGQGRYSAYETGMAAHVEEGVVVSFRPVQIGSDSSGTGAVVGGVTGAVIGSQFGGRRSDHAAFGVLGALAGAVAGNAIEKDGSQHTGYAYTVRIHKTGELVEIVQPDASPIPNGVRVAISYGAKVRISPIDGYAPPPPPPPR
jgi:outer membrane lipoprotein SlyB